MNYLLALAAVVFLTFPYNAHAAKVYTAQDAQGNIIQLMDDRCAVPDWMQMKKAAMHYQGKDYEACWLAIGDTVVVFDSAGDVTPLPKSIFKPETSV